jgi:hypothetical protein
VATDPNAVASPNGQPTGQLAASPAAAVIRLSPLSEQERGLDWQRMLPAWVISGGIHVVLIALFVFFFWSDAADATAPAQNVIETIVDEEKEEDKNLINPDIGLDPEQEFSVDTERMEAVTVSGETTPDEPVGQQNAEVAPPMTSEPPPGLGGGDGAMESDAAAVAGPASMNVGGQGGTTRLGFRGNSAARNKLLTSEGGNTETEACVARGLIWLSKQQKPDGRWSIDGSHKDDIAGTGMALLPFLAAGQTHKSGKDNKYQKNVLSGLTFLTGKQKPDGTFTGSTGTYAHAIATVALCEAYGMTQDPKLQKPAQAALNVIVKGQGSNGSWGYSYGGTGDTSIVGWQIQALKSGVMANLNVPKDVFHKAGVFLDSVAGSYQNQSGATYGYTTKGGTPALSAVGLLCRQYMGWGPKNIKLQAGIEYLKAHPPTSDLAMYYYYYATQVVHFYGGPEWKEFWNPKMRQLLVDKQEKAQNQNFGSWAPATDTIGSAGGRLLTTCTCLLTLEVYYRHLPLYRRDNGGLKELEG